jgi:hypothetical protein
LSANSSNYRTGTKVVSESEYERTRLLQTSGAYVVLLKK